MGREERADSFGGVAGEQRVVVSRALLHYTFLFGFETEGVGSAYSQYIAFFFFSIIEDSDTTCFAKQCP
jgi:hypothetical protein